jgi:hypothetical protein
MCTATVFCQSCLMTESHCSDLHVVGSKHAEQTIHLGAGKTHAQQPTLGLRSVIIKLALYCMQEENKEEAALDALLNPERNTMLQMAAADAASTSRLRTAAEKQVRWWRQ